MATRIRPGAGDDTRIRPERSASAVVLLTQAVLWLDASLSTTAE